MQRTRQLQTAQSKATSSADLPLHRILQNPPNRRWKPRGYVEKDACFLNLLIRVRNQCTKKRAVGPYPGIKYTWGKPACL